MSDVLRRAREYVSTRTRTIIRGGAACSLLLELESEATSEAEHDQHEDKNKLSTTSATVVEFLKKMGLSDYEETSSAAPEGAVAEGGAASSSSRKTVEELESDLEACKQTTRSALKAATAQILVLQRELVVLHFYPRGMVMVPSLTFKIKICTLFVLHQVRARSQVDEFFIFVLRRSTI